MAIRKGSVGSRINVNQESISREQNKCQSAVVPSAVSHTLMKYITMLNKTRPKYKNVKRKAKNVPSVDRNIKSLSRLKSSEGPFKRRK